MNNLYETVAAAVALSKILEIKQYGLNVDYEYLLGVEGVRKIILLAKNKLKLDLLNDKLMLSFDEVEKYENFLDELVKNSLSVKYSDSFIQDELLLLENAQQFSLSEFREFGSADFRFSTKLIYDSLGLTITDMQDNIRNAYSIQVIDKERDNFLVATRVEAKSKSLIALFHVTLNMPTGKDINSTNFNLSSIPNKFTKGTNNQLRVSSCFIFNGYNPRYNSPIRMFLQAISKYALAVTIGNVTKKLFVRGSSSSLFINAGDNLKLRDEMFSDRSGGTMQLKKTRTGYEYKFVYSIYLPKMIGDFEKGLFI